jgi:hypothetical protein
VHVVELILKSVPLASATEKTVIGPGLPFGLCNLTPARSARPTLRMPNEIEVFETVAITGCGVEVAVGVGVGVTVAVEVGVIVTVAVGVDV